MCENFKDYYFVFLKVKNFAKETILSELKIDETEYDQMADRLTEKIDGIQALIAEGQPIGSEFLKLTSSLYLTQSDQSKGKPQPPLSLPYDQNLPKIDLPDPEKAELKETNIRKLILKRKSHRSYTKAPYSLEELAYLLWATQGVKEVMKTAATKRTVPSAGARHAFETYLLINRVGGLEPGLYRYLALEHKLLRLTAPDNFADELTERSWGQDMIKNSAATFIWTAVVERMAWRYGQRGFRYLFLDAGHVCQNLHLAAESINAGVCPIGAYCDELINDLLNLDGEKEFVIYLASSGKIVE